MKRDPEYRLAMEIEASARRHSVELTLAHGEAAKRVAESHDEWVTCIIWKRIHSIELDLRAFLENYYPGLPFITAPIVGEQGHEMGQRFQVVIDGHKRSVGFWAKNDLADQDGATGGPK